jgi:hypothetical protein
MVDEFTTTCAICAYHHYNCEFESRSWRDGFLLELRFPPPIKTDITEIVLKVALSMINLTKSNKK